MGRKDHDHDSGTIVKRAIDSAVPAKAEKWRRRAEELLREAGNTAKRLQILRDLLRWSQRELYSRSTYSRNVVRDSASCLDFDVNALAAVEALNEHLARVLMDLGEVRTILRLERYIENGKTQADPDAFLLDIMSSVRFLNRFNRLVGSSTDQAIGFGLQLIAIWEGFDRRDVKVEDLKSAKRTPPEAVTGEEYERGLDYGMIAKKIHETAAEIEDVPGSTSNERNGWLYRLIESASTSPAAEDVLVSILEFMTISTNTPTIPTLQKNEGLAELPKKFQEALARFPHLPGVQRVAKYMFFPKIVLPPTVRATFDRWSEARQAQFLRDQQEGEKVINWYKEHRDEVATAFDERCRAIMERPRRGLRPGGYDHVEVRSVPLRNAGIRAVVFHPEGCDFPNVRVHILVRKETPTLFTFRTELKDFELGLHDEVVRSKIHFDHRDELAELLEFTVVDMLYRIVAAEKELREKKSKWSSTGSEGNSPSPRTIPVRPFLRRLVEGRHATGYAQTNATQVMGWRTLPPGFTFVLPTIRGGNLVYDLPTQPTAVYTDDDLRLLID